MSITYPLDLPSTPAPSKVRIYPRAVVAVGVSPFTAQQQVYEHQGQVWQADIALPAMKRADAEPWLATFLKLNGRRGTFRLGDPLGRTPRGSVSGTPVVDGAGQTGKLLNVRGLTFSGAFLKAGDYLQIGDRLYKNLNDATADGAGKCTLDIWPRLRESPSDGAAITTSNTTGLFRLTLNEMPWDEDIGQIYGISFSAVEAI